MERRRPTTILLLEAPDDCRADYAAALRGSGLEMLTVGDSHAAPTAVPTVHHRAIVSDMDSDSRNDRLSLCREVQGDPRTKRIPVLFMTETMTAQDVDLATNSGVLVLTMARHDGAELVGATNGVLTAQRAASVSPAVRRPRDAKGTRHCR
jgi:CheY-like chemotaxis protein